MYDYVDGKADWMAYGLPVEGRDGPFLGEMMSEVASCAAEGTVGDARRLLAADAGAAVVVLGGGGLAIGQVDVEVLEGHDDGESLLDVMSPVPTTVRPSVTVSSVAESGGGRRLVTTSDGRLLGVATVEQDHDHDHEAEFDQELAQVVEAIEERFGDREPSEAELRTFLHQRLVAEGRSAEDADRFLDQLESGEED